MRVRENLWLGLALLLASACSKGSPEKREVGSPTPGATHFALVGGTVVGIGSADVTILGAEIEAVGTAEPGIERVDVNGRFLVPAFIDSHVHLAYYSVAAELVSRGVIAAVDLAAPIETLGVPSAPLTLLPSGPMLTAVGGYPVTSWGAGGYGLEIATPEQAEAAVDRLFEAGAAVIKMPFTGEPTLDDATAKAVADRAHAHGLKVFAHALGAADAARAATAGVDVFAHTPTETLDAPTVAAFASRAVVSTLATFGGAQSLANFGALRAAGATVLYGTDLGNSRDAGIQLAEIEQLLQAGLDGAAILEAGTRAPARYFGLGELGEIAVGKRACLLVLEQDPLADPRTLARPLIVYVDGQRQGG